VTARPDVTWGTDATAAVTLVEGAATIFAAIGASSDSRHAAPGMRCAAE
jgi:hypothetical protein